MRRKKEQSEQARSAGDARLSPAEIQQVEFRLAFRGYNERDVDAFLDRITEDMSTYIEEIQRLRTVASSPEAPTSGNGSETAAREAEEIVARAKERAAEIVREAEKTAASASAGGSAAITGGVDARGAIAPFLNRERDFLQSLGGLVQGHAEEIKQMVLSLRARTEADAPAAAPTRSGSVAGDDGGATPPEPEPERARSEAASAQPRPVSRPGPVVLPEAAETAGAGEPEPVSAEHPSSERSLKDLIWGED